MPRVLYNYYHSLLGLGVHVPCPSQTQACLIVLLLLSALSLLFLLMKRPSRKPVLPGQKRTARTRSTSSSPSSTEAPSGSAHPEIYGAFGEMLASAFFRPPSPQNAAVEINAPVTAKHKKKPENWLVKQPYDAFLVLDVEATCLQGTNFDWPNEIIVSGLPLSAFATIFKQHNLGMAGMFAPVAGQRQGGASEHARSCGRVQELRQAYMEATPLRILHQPHWNYAGTRVLLRWRHNTYL